MNVGVYCISARRPSAVPAMRRHCEEIIWVVPEDDAADYRLAGAETILSIPEPGAGRFGLPLARNVALDYAFTAGEVCVQTDDDFRWAKLRTSADHWELTTFKGMIDHLVKVLSISGTRLSGIPPTNNRYFAKPGVSSQAFMIASMIAIAPSKPRFDETLPLKEDYDFTCRHLDEYGSVARSGDVVAEYLHYRNAGGAVSYRTDQVETEVCEILLNRWPQYLRPNARRDHELLIKSRRT